jgi:hypothetical protein
MFSGSINSMRLVRILHEIAGDEKSKMAVPVGCSYMMYDVVTFCTMSYAANKMRV